MRAIFFELDGTRIDKRELLARALAELQAAGADRVFQAPHDVTDAVISSPGL